jgi:rubrerythrin
VRDEVEARLADEVVELAAAGDAVRGEFRCAECAYGVTIHRELPHCPMCGGSSWEPASRSPAMEAASALPL